jgi:hypothetical protein
MNKRLAFSLATSATAAGVLVLLITRGPAAQPPPFIVEHCKRAAELLYDITWAAACRTTADDSTDCTLPDTEAAKVNPILASEESRCLAAEAPSWIGR